MTVYKRDCNKTKYISLLIKDDPLLENIVKFARQSVISLKKNLIMNLYIMKTIYKLK